MAEIRPTPDLILSDEISKCIPYSQNHLRRLESAGQFPRRVRIGANRVAWVRGEINEWIEQRIAGRSQE